MGNSPTNSSSQNSTPSSSRTRIARLPFGKAARATRTVSAGTSCGSLTRNDTADLRTHDVGPREQVSGADKVTRSQFANSVR
ncbi:hypothetical protein GCM10010245_72280 [Streptomyces spectabilis]|nr:hypothetical protein GCM10010245_72280 [Streptomyces spectabilis]